jgi:pimeloyl-ACP methyl ester carboxylesterase
MKREVIDGLHIGRLERAATHTFLFVHGVMDRGATFLNVTRRMTKESWLVYDRRGYGRSTAVGVPVFSDHVADLKALIDVVSRSGPVVLVGHSLGGTIALSAASHSPESVAAVVVHEAPLPWLDWWPIRGEDGRRLEDESPEEAVRRVMERTTGEAVWDALPEVVRAQRLSEGPTMVSELVSVRNGCPFDTGHLRMPVVVSRGSLSGGHRQMAQQWLVDCLPQSSAVIVDGASHNVQASHPEEFSSLLGDVLASVITAKPS